MNEIVRIEALMKLQVRHQKFKKRNNNNNNSSNNKNVGRMQGERERGRQTTTKEGWGGGGEESGGGVIHEKKNKVLLCSIDLFDAKTEPKNKEHPGLLLVMNQNSPSTLPASISQGHFIQSQRASAQFNHKRFQQQHRASENQKPPQDEKTQTRRKQ